MFKWTILAASLVAVVVLLIPAKRLIISVRLASSINRFASGTSGEELEVSETKIYRRSGSAVYEAVLYSPAKSRPSGAVVLVPGISELGCYHPRLVAFSRILADSGLVVITPDIKKFRNFHITAEPIHQVLFWHGEAENLEEIQFPGRIGLAGISFSGTLAIMAAAKPEVRNSVGFVVAIGPYFDLLRCTKTWLETHSDDPESNHYSNTYYARWIVMLAALDLVTENQDRTLLRDVLKRLLLQQDLPPVSGDALTAEGWRWYRLATALPGQPDPELALRIQRHLISNVYPGLDPKSHLGKVKCPVYLIHGTYDDLIPPLESKELHDRLSNSYLIVSPFLTHTHPNAVPLKPTQKIRALWEAASFCYGFSKSIL